MGVDATASRRHDHPLLVCSIGRVTRHPDHERRISPYVAVVAVLLAAAMLPHVSTWDPTAGVEDPAMIPGEAVVVRCPEPRVPIRSRKHRAEPSVDALGPVSRVLFVAVTGDITFITLLRLPGQRVLAQMTAVDLVITLTLGSAFVSSPPARWPSSRPSRPSLALLQWVIANIRGRARRLRRSVAVWPALRYYDGEPATVRSRATICSRRSVHHSPQQGMRSLGSVQAFILEENGAFTGLSKSQYRNGSVVRNVVDAKR